MARLKGLIVHVAVNNEHLPEYEDDEQGEVGADEATDYGDSDGADYNDRDENPFQNKITKYVEAVSGAAFKVDFEREHDYSRYGGTGLSIEVLLDGKYMSGQIFCDDRHTTFTEGRRKCNKGQWTLERFRFTDILITETPPNSKDSTQLMDNLGVITVNVYRAENIQAPRPKDRERKSNYSELVPQSISEKSLKGRSLSLCSSLGAPEALSPVNSVRCDFLDPKNAPYAVFNFKYRSRKSLQDMYVIPRSPTPLPLEERPRDQLTREELLELLNRRAATVKPEIKPESTPRSGVKRERDPEYEELMASARSKKTRAKQEIEVIDLLDD